MARLKILTLDEHQLAGAAARLAEITAFLRPQLIIGIRSGGYAVAQAMASHFSQSVLLPVTCRRPSTEKKRKSSLLKILLCRLPAPITGRLRIIEHVVLTRISTHKQETFLPDKGELLAIKNGLRRLTPDPNILIVDDSVDSGATLATVVSLVRAAAGSQATIKTAVITVTTTKPLIEPDYLLYRYVLCRFPWSLDFKN